jgi:tetratricopeptide (TPR) repeat protein
MKGPSVPRRTRLLFVAVVLTAAIAWFAWPLSVATQVDAAIRRHDWASATAGLDRLDRLQPARSAHVLRRARILRRQDRLADSIAALDEAARLGHDAEEIRRQRILTVAQSGRIGEVEPEVQRLLGAAVDDAFAEECYEALVKGYVACHRIDDARQCVAFWCEWQPEDPRAHAAAGLVAEKLELHGEAIAAFRHALSLAPHDVAVRGRVAAHEVHSGRLDVAAAEYARCLAEVPGDAGFLLGLADCRLRLGESAAAATLLHDALTLDLTPEQAAVALASLASLAAESRSTRDALALYRDAVRLDTRNITARFGLASMLGSLGDRAAAEELAEAQRLTDMHRRLTTLTRQAVGEPGNAELRVEIAAILADLGLQDAGSRWLETATPLDTRKIRGTDALDDHLDAGGRRGERHERTDTTNTAIGRDDA